MLAVLGMSLLITCGGGGGGGGGSTVDQIEIVARVKNIITVDGLRFKDLNGNGSLDEYEDWRLSPEERAADLIQQMSLSEKLGLMAHPVLSDAPTSANTAVSSSLSTLINSKNIRFGLTRAHTSGVTPRATWANNVQEVCEASSLGIPFVLSMEPCHSEGNGRVKAAGFSRWPQELGMAASGSASLIETFGKYAAIEYRAIGVRIALSPSADLLTEPRWYNGQFTFGENASTVGNMVAAYIRGFQGSSLGSSSVACVVKHFPGAGPATDGWDARLSKGKYLTYPGNNIDYHLSVFEKAFSAGVAGVMPAYGILQNGSWSGLGGLLNGSTIEQVAAAFNGVVLNTVLKGHYDYKGIVVADAGIMNDPGLSPLGAPWGMEANSKAQRAAKAVNAGVEQFVGIDDLSPIQTALSTSAITEAQVDAAAEKALILMFKLGLFENPYVDASQAPALCNTDDAYRAGLDALNRSMVLIVNANKPAGWLNGSGDGTQTGDKGNAGNGSGRVLPAPPGEPYVSAGCSYYIMGNFDMDYVRSVSTGYGDLTNDATSIGGVPVSTAQQRIAYSDYVFIRINAPYTKDNDSGDLNYSIESLEYASNANASDLDLVQFARDAINAVPGSNCQIIVGIDGGRPSVVSEILAMGVSGVYLEWGVTDKVFLDVAFGIVNGVGKLPVGLPLSNSVVQNQSQQKEDVPGDGQHATFISGWGYETRMF